MCNSPHYLSKLNVKNDDIDIRPKLKNCLFPAPDRPLENVETRNISWVICNNFFFFFLVTRNRDRKFWYCSRIYVRNWFTLLNEQNPLLDFEGTRFVNELWKKKKSPYLPTHRWNGGSGAGNKHIFKGGLIIFSYFSLPSKWLIITSVRSTSESDPHMAPRQAEATLLVVSSWLESMPSNVVVACFFRGSAIFEPAPHKQNLKAWSMVSLKIIMVMVNFMN